MIGNCGQVIYSQQAVNIVRFYLGYCKLLSSEFYQPSHRTGVTPGPFPLCVPLQFEDMLFRDRIFPKVL